MKHLNILSKPILALVAFAGMGLTAAAQPLSGTYTVGGTAPNYATLSDAVTALNTKGVSGPVTLNLRNGTYAERVEVKNITGASATNRITIKSENNNAANVTVAINATSTATNFTIKLANASYVTLKHLTIKNDGTTYGRALVLEGTASNDSVLNCNLSTITRTASSTNTVVVFADPLTGADNVFMNNAISNGSYGLYYSGTNTTTLTDRGVFINNRFENQYTYATYFYYTNDLKFIGNTITTNSASTAYYGIRVYYGDGAQQIIGNKVSGAKGGYAMYLYYNDADANNKGIVANNVVTIGSASATANGIRSYYSSNQKIYNNSVNILSASATAGYAGYFYYSNATTYVGNEIYNNVFANTGGGYSMYVYNPTFDNKFDYNNLYTSGAKLVDRGTPAADFLTLKEWRAAHGLDMNSISYNPGFTSTTDLTPDPGNPASWSLNGRGVHIAGNDRDVNGNTRVTDRTLGVPDIGAYEFTPTATPPAATASPATPVAGGTQYFTFGEDSVAAITWDAASIASSSVTVRQYTGTMPAGIGTLSPTSTYFYVDISVPPGTYNHTTDIYYKEPWVGTVASESALRLAKKNGTNPWVGSSPAVSKADVTRRIINTPGLTTFGWFTGIDVANNAGVSAITEPVGYKCAGTYAVKAKIKNNGSNTLNTLKIEWSIDGVLQPVINLSNPLPILGEEEITLGNIVLNGKRKEIKVWTSEPNGFTDPVESDDTAKASVNSGLNGIYTVGGTTPDYNTVSDAVNDLNASGICGPVTFNIRDGNYAGQARLNKIDGMAAANRIVFQSESGNKNAVVLNFAPAAAAENYVFSLNNASFVTIRNLTLRNTGADFGRVLEMTEGASLDSVLNCVIEGPVRTVASSNTSLLFADPLTGSNNVFIGNDFNNGSYGLYYSGTGTTNLTDGGVFLNNNFRDQYTYATYFYYTNNLKFNYNTITTTSSDNLFYGVRTYYSDGAQEIIGNRISGALGGYAMYLYYNDGTPTAKGIVANNVISIGSATNTAQGIRSYYSSNQRIYNNSVNILSASLTAGVAGYFYYSSTTYTGNEIYNNVFANNGGGYAMYVYNPTYNNIWDYNNLYTTGAKLIDRGTPAAEYANLSEWRAAGKQDLNSISYNPGFTSNTDLAPNPGSPASWSLNGRGIHIAGNGSDINGNVRVTAKADGVPDIGAFEFTPTSTPPDATAVPANAAPGAVQHYLFGEDTVATITWNAQLKVTTPLSVKQYTGTKPLQMTTPMANAHPYFYTAIDEGLGRTFDFNTELYYKEPWLGTTGAEAKLKMAHNTANNWVGYSDNSNADVTGNIVIAKDLNRFGYFTVIDSGAVPSAYIVALGSTIICSGDSVTLRANTGAGLTYRWYKDGVAISGAFGNTYKAKARGDYYVTVSSATSIARSAHITVTVVAPPAATISYTGAPNICPGGGSISFNGGNAADVTYQWQLNDVDIPGAVTSNFSSTSAGKYTLKVTNLGCTVTSAPVNITAGPLVVSLGRDTGMCYDANKPFILDAGYPGAKYRWSTGDTTQTIKAGPSANEYWVEVIAGPNCIDRDTVEVLTKPTPTVTGISYKKDGFNTYYFTPAGARNVNIYLWIFDRNGVITTFNGEIPPPQVYENNMIVKLVVANDCGNDTTTLVNWTTSIEEAGRTMPEVNIYPNPATNYTTIELNGNANMNEVIIVSSVGSVVYKQAMPEGTKTTRVDVSNFAAGNYMVRIRAGEDVITKAISVVR